MKEYSYIGVVDAIFDPGCRFIVRSTDCPIHDYNIVSFTIDDRIRKGASRSILADWQ